MCREHLGILPHTDMRRLAPVPSQPDYQVMKAISEAGEEIQISSEDESYLQWAEKAIQDPLSDDFDRVWQGTAQSNTEIFRRVFRCVPDDTGKSWEEASLMRKWRCLTFDHTYPSLLFPLLPI